MATFTCVKRGVRPLITRELVEDGLFSIVELELKKAGARVENAINSECIDEILLDSGTAFDTVTTAGAMGAKAVVSAIEQVAGYGFQATDMVMCPGFEAYLFRDFVPALYAGSLGESFLASGKLSNIFGLSCGVSTVTYNGGTYTWAYTTDGYIGALVYDRNAAGGLVFARDITVEQYNDPIHDLVGCAVTARFDAQSMLANSIVRIQY